MPTSADLGTYARAAAIGNNRQNCAVSTFWLRCGHARYTVNTIEIRCTYAVTADLDKSCIRSFTTQSRSPLIRWWCTYDDDDPDTIWAALVTLMQPSLRSGYDLIGDICPDHIDICTDHCRSLVHANRYHGSRIRCPAFGSYSKTACHSRATDCPGTTIPMGERRQLNWSHCRQNRSNRASAEQIKRSHC